MSRFHWTEAEAARSARWHSENESRPPRRVVVADDRMKADHAYRLACEGTALLWRGDYHGARQLLSALARRVDRKGAGAAAAGPGTGEGPSPAEVFHAQRRARRHRARVLGMLLVLLEGDHTLALRRAPDVRQACAEAYGPPPGEPVGVALTELLGVLGAHQWRTKGVEVPALGARVHPHYGVFSPVRGEYVDLVARAPLPAAVRSGGPGTRTAFDLGTGTGVLAAVLARRGVARVVATDISPRALACARATMDRLGLADRVDVRDTALYPEGRAGLVVCNPPWIPARPSSTLEQGVYDPGGRMFHAFLDGLSAHLEPGGEGWLILSDLAEHLGLRTRRELLDAVAGAGLRVVDRSDVRPRHPRAVDPDPDDPLRVARAAEVTSLWRLAPVGPAPAGSAPVG
ncbi:methyltransferase [Streptomyces sp. NPDC059009]|uniref:methyltransferase n=1 Tax=Streptomyces sp. NPDC059009 TaxID=3346694 RepID=UPI0036A4F067